MKALLRFGIALWLALAAGIAGSADAPPALVVIAHAKLDGVDAPTLLRLYQGRAVEVNGTPVTVVNLAPGHPLRAQFLARVLNQDEERYIAYWTVRRHVGKGIPPRQFATPSEVIEFVQATPGGMGYIAVTDLRPGLNVVLRP